MTATDRCLVDPSGAVDRESLEILFATGAPGLCASTFQTNLRRIGYKFCPFAAIQVAMFGK